VLAALTVSLRAINDRLDRIEDCHRSERMFDDAMYDAHDTDGNLWGCADETPNPDNLLALGASSAGGPPAGPDPIMAHNHQDFYSRVFNTRIPEFPAPLDADLDAWIDHLIDLFQAWCLENNVPFDCDPYFTSKGTVE
jgi:hypothetical protein